MIQGKPSASAGEKFLGGQIVRRGKQVLQYLYVPANTVQGEVLVKAFDGDEEYCPKAVAAATSSVYQHVVVATEDQGATAGFQWCVIEGECQALVDGTTDVAKDDFLEVLNTADGFTKDATTRSTNSAAIARAAQATDSDVLTYVYLTGERVLVAAS